MNRQYSRRLCRPAPLLLGLLLASPLAANAQINFVFSYTDPAGVGFNDATQGAARKTALEQTATLVGSYFPGYNATISLTVNGAETTDGVLAAAGSESNAADICTPGFGSRGDVGVKVLGGADPSGSADGSVTVNFEDQTWGLGDTIAAGDFDFKSTMLHELLHAMGFSHSVERNGNSACSQSPGTPGAWNPYDHYLGDLAGQIINETSFILDGSRWSNVVTGGTGDAGALWQGPQGKAANGNAPIPLYSPTTFSEGSSIAHLDDDFFTSSSLLMEAATDAGPGTRTLSNIEVGIFKDMGFANATNTPGGSGSSRIFRDGFEN